MKLQTKFNTDNLENLFVEVYKQDSNNTLFIKMSSSIYYNPMIVLCDVNKKGLTYKGTYSIFNYYSKLNFSILFNAMINDIKREYVPFYLFQIKAIFKKSIIKIYIKNIHLATIVPILILKRDGRIDTIVYNTYYLTDIVRIKLLINYYLYILNKIIYFYI